uniref:Uncharacterized protein n=1 Tax=Rhipicephalus zambeziensis TaxID=60191 RepID=A0A224Y8X1_9ACAR
MGTAVRRGSETVYYLDPAQLKMQEAAGGVQCVPVPGCSGRSRKSVYRMAPSSLQPGRVLQPLSGMTFAGGSQCDACLPQRLLQQLSSEDASYDGAAATSNEPKILRLVPQGRNVRVEEVKPLPRVWSSRSARQKRPEVMQIVEDNDCYKLVSAGSSESDVPVESDTFPDCIEELMHRRRAPDREPDVVASPVYVTKVPSSRRSSSRRLASSSLRALSRDPSPPSSSPRCSRCAACKSCGTAQSDSMPTTTRSRSSKWYE